MAKKKTDNIFSGGRRRGQTAKIPANKKNSQQLQIELDRLNEKYQIYEARAEDKIEELNNELAILGQRYEEAKTMQEDLESTAEQMISELQSETETLAIQLEQKQQAMNNNDTNINIQKTTTAIDLQEMQRLRDENHQLKTRIRLRGLDPNQLDLAPKKIQINKHDQEKFLEELEELKEEKQVLLDEMDVQTEETEELNECILKKVADRKSVV